MDTLLIWISHYGYFGIFSLLVLGIVGLPIPDETLLTLSGFLIYKGTLHWIPTFIAAYLGSITGISISYAIGSTFGHHIILKYGHYVHINEERLQKAQNWFEKIGLWALLFGYFIPGVRHVVAILAGTSELQLWEFALFAYTGGLIWTATFISIGYFFGDKWSIVLDTVNHHIIIVSIVTLIALLFFFIYKKIKEKKKSDTTIS
jgi:membrane protein DedA with SNARE-associated domain